MMDADATNVEQFSSSHKDGRSRLKLNFQCCQGLKVSKMLKIKNVADLAMLHFCYNLYKKKKILRCGRTGPPKEVEFFCFFF